MILAVLSVMFLTAPALAGTVIPDDVGSSNPYFITVANDAGASADLYGDDTYAMFFNGGSRGVTFETDNLYNSTDREGENLVSDTGEGSFYLNFFGGRGGLQRVVLMLAVNGTIPDDFRVHFKTSGYKLDYTPALAGRLGALTPDNISYQETGIDEDFTRSDFIYGPQVTRPPATTPIYRGQNISDTDDTFQIMFIDTGLGIVGNRKDAHGTVNNTDLINTGKLKVEYSFENLGGNLAVIDAYGWLYSGSDSPDNLNPSISWTNKDLTNGDLKVLVPEPAVAAFTANATSGKAPLAVQFTDASTGSPTTWAWDFENDGVVDSTKQNATHIYTAPGIYTVNLTVTNVVGSNTTVKTGYIAVGDGKTVPLPANRFINIRVANDEGVKYDVQNGAAASGGKYEYVPDTYWVMFRRPGGGLNPMDISTDPTVKSGQVTRTANQSGKFWVTFSGQRYMHEGILMLAVNGTVPDDFSVRVRSSGYDFTPPIPGARNNDTVGTPVYVDGAVDEIFTGDDFIYGPQIWRPCSIENYPIFDGQDMSDTANTFRLMFIDLGLGATQTGTDGGAIKVEYQFNNLTSFAVFDSYGWYSASNHGTGIIMTNSGSEYAVIGDGSTYDPNVPASLTISPVDAQVKVGDRQKFTAHPLDCLGHAMSGVDLAWTSENETVGTIDETGMFTALSPGETAIVVSNGSVQARAGVSVSMADGDREQKNAIDIPGCDFATGQDGKKKVSLNTSDNDVTLKENEIVVRDETFTMTITTEGSPEMKDGTVNGTVAGIKIETAPVVTEFGDAGRVSAAVGANLTGVPSSAGLDVTVSDTVGADARSAFELAASTDGLTVDAVAYVMNVNRKNLKNGDDISDATIRMSVSSAWVAAHGGSKSIQIIRWSEDGTKEVLPTKSVGSDGDMEIFEAVSEKGFSLFGLTTVSSQQPSPSPSPSTSSHSSSGGGRSSLAAGAAEHIGAGDAATLRFDHSPITEIEVHAKAEIPEILVTVEAGEKPEGAVAPEGEVYECLCAMDYKVPADSLKRATIRFGVPTNWVDERVSSPDHLALYHYDEEKDGWVLLSTVFEAEENGCYTYYADSDSFGYFAIVGKPDAQKDIVSSAGSAGDDQGSQDEVKDQQNGGADAVPATTAKPAPLFGGGMIICAIFVVASVLALLNRRVR